MISIPSKYLSVELFQLRSIFPRLRPLHRSLPLEMISLYGVLLRSLDLESCRSFLRSRQPCMRAPQSQKRFPEPQEAENPAGEGLASRSVQADGRQHRSFVRPEESDRG